MDSQTVRLYMVLDSYIATSRKNTRTEEASEAVAFYNENEVGRGREAKLEEAVPVTQQDLLDWEEMGYGSGFLERLNAMEADLEKPFLFGRNEQRWDLMPALAGPNPFEAQN